MPISGAWQNEAHTIYALTFEQRWTVDQYAQSFDEATRQLESEAHPVDVLLDMTHSAMPPLQIITLGGKLLQRHAKNLQAVFVVVTNPTIHNLVRIGIRANVIPSLPISVFMSRHEAVRAIQQSHLGDSTEA